MYYRCDPFHYTSISTTDKRIREREASKSNKSVRVCVNDLSLIARACWEQDILNDESTLQCKKMRESPRIARDHMQARVEWARLLVTQTFSQEKLNIDGPDGWDY